MIDQLEMKNIDKQMITHYKIGDSTSRRQYFVVSGSCEGIATVDKTGLKYSYMGDDLG